MNVWTYSGRVGADAELRTTASGEKVLSFRVCNTVGFGDRKIEQWVDNSYWGARAEKIAGYVKKGDRITVSGELKLESFQRKDGTPGSKLAVRVNDLDLAAKSEGGAASADPSDKHVKGGGGHDYNAPLNGGAGGRNGGKPAFGNDDLLDEIPFVHP